MSITLQEIDGSFSVYKYPPAAAPSLWPQLLSLAEPSTGRSFFSVSVSEKELSIVTTAELPRLDGYFFNKESGYAAFVIKGQLDFSLVGILATLTSALAREGVSVFAVSTFDTDYLLVKQENVEKARTAFSTCGYSFE
ncbi:hypothetical protein HDU67_004224 [Dinochytrium kinnereticum]|nr:hypothetical protein HDU67_004224 [Dinochytrium kinnereticum]